MKHIIFILHNPIKWKNQQWLQKQPLLVLPYALFWFNRIGSVLFLVFAVLLSVFWLSRVLLFVLCVVRHLFIDTHIRTSGGPLDIALNFELALHPYNVFIVLVQAFKAIVFDFGLIAVHDFPDINVRNQFDIFWVRNQFDKRNQSCPCLLIFKELEKQDISCIHGLRHVPEAYILQDGLRHPQLFAELPHSFVLLLFCRNYHNLPIFGFALNRLHQSQNNSIFECKRVPISHATFLLSACYLIYYNIIYIKNQPIS